MAVNATRLCRSISLEHVSQFYARQSSFASILPGHVKLAVRPETLNSTSFRPSAALHLLSGTSEAPSFTTGRQPSPSDLAAIR